ncbi:hypothetical protein AB4168_00170 [Vibrio splendidus]
MFKKFLSINVLNSLLGVVTGIILARNLEPELRGAVGQIILLTTYSLSVSSSSMRDMLLSQKQNSIFINKYNLIISLILFFLIPLFVIYIYDFNEFILFVYSFGLVTYYNSVKLALLQIKGEFVKLSLIKLIVPIAYSFQLLLFHSYLNVTNVLVILVISNLLCAIFLYTYKIKIDYDTQYDKNKIKSYISVVFSMVVIVISSQLDKFILPIHISKSEFAFYMIATTLIATPLSVVGDSVSNYIVIKVKEKVNPVTLMYWVAVFVLSSASIVIVMYGLSDFVIPLLFGENYIKARDYIFVCGLISLTNNCRLLITAILRGVGDNVKILYLNLSLLIFVISGLFILISFEMTILNALACIFSLVFILIIFLSFFEIKRCFK